LTQPPAPDAGTVLVNSPSLIDFQKEMAGDQANKKKKKKKKKNNNNSKPKEGIIFIFNLFLLFILIFIFFFRGRSWKTKKEILCPKKAKT